MDLLFGSKLFDGLDPPYGTVGARVSRRTEIALPEEPSGGVIPQPAVGDERLARAPDRAYCSDMTTIREAMSRGAMLERDRLEALARERGEGLVTLHLPTHRFGPQTQGGPIRLKNLIAEAANRCLERGCEATVTQATLEPARELLQDADFWQHQGGGLSLLLSERRSRLFRLPTTVEELAYVGDRYCVRPLLPAVTTSQLFFVLALSQKSVRLVVCTRTGAREVDLEDIPQSLEDVVGYDWEQRSLQFHTSAPRTGGGARPAVFHGQGGGSEESKDEVERFLRRVDDGLGRLLQGHSAPLVVAAVDFLIPIFHRVSRYGQIVEGGVEGNPEHTSLEELHARALELATPVLDRLQHERLERLEELTGTDRVVSGIDDVLRAALDARVETLFLRSRSTAWGRFDDASREVVTHEQRRSGDDDLYDLALGYALASGADTFAIDEGLGRSGDVSIAALLRF